MLRKPISNCLALGTLLLVLLTLPGIASSYHGGIGGEQVNAGETIDDVAKEGCFVTTQQQTIRSDHSR